MKDGWIGVDFDGTLAHYDHWRGIDHLGKPIKKMVKRVKAWLKEGKEVRIFTARVCGEAAATARLYIETWCEEHLGQVLAVTNVKDFAMEELWDDRAIQVRHNTGVTLREELAKAHNDLERAINAADKDYEGLSG